MSRKRTQGDDTQAFILRGIDGNDYRKARVRAILDNRDMSELLRSFIHEYAYGRLDVPIQRGRKRRK
jgi:hypothetical protein